jgi:hypothetical protein
MRWETYETLRDRCNADPAYAQAKQKYGQAMKDGTVREQREAFEEMRKASAVIYNPCLAERVRENVKGMSNG